MTFDDFVEVFKKSNDSRIKVMDDLTKRRDALVLNSEQKREVSIAEIGTGYLRYNTTAVDAVVQLQHSEPLLAAWTPLLKLFARCTSFAIPKVDYYCVTADFKPGEHSADRSYGRSMTAVKTRLLEQSCALTALFVPRAVDCLAAAHCKVQSLSLLHWFLPQHLVTWRYLCRWTDVNLSSLEKLFIELSIPDSILGDEDEERQTQFVQAWQDETQHLLGLGASTLRSFEQLNFFWGVHHTQPDSPVALPMLTDLKLGECEVSSLWFSRLMKGMPQLRELVIGRAFSHLGFGAAAQSMSLYDEPTDNWKVIFDALRSHPNLVRGKVWIDFEATWLLMFDKSNVLSHWKLDYPRPYNEAQREYWVERCTLFSEALGDPSAFMLHLEEEHERGDKLTPERLGTYYVEGAIDWPGVQRLQMERDD